jgi:hypothetical protein
MSASGSAAGAPRVPMTTTITQRAMDFFIAYRTLVGAGNRPTELQCRPTTQPAQSLPIIRLRVFDSLSHWSPVDTIDTFGSVVPSQLRNLSRGGGVGSVTVPLLHGGRPDCKTNGHGRSVFHVPKHQPDAQARDWNRQLPQNPSLARRASVCKQRRKIVPASRTDRPWTNGTDPGIRSGAQLYYWDGRASDHRPLWTCPPCWRGLTGARF